MTPPRRRWRRLRRTLAYGIAGTVILAGLCVALLGQALPLLARDPQAVGRWLSERAGRPIQVEAVQARWSRQGPLFDLEGLRIGEGAQRLDIDRAALQLDVYAGLLPGRPFASLRLDGLALTLERDAGGQWQLHGIGRGGGDSGLAQFDGLGQLVIDAARLRVVDAQGGVIWSLPRFDARLQDHGERLRFSAAAYPERGAPLLLRGDFDRARRNGHGYVALRNADLATWMAGFAPEGVELLSGQADGEIWARMADGRWVDAEARLATNGLSLRHRQSEGGEAGTAQELTIAPLHARWHADADGWQAGVDGDDGLRLRAAERDGQRRLAADSLDLGPWLATLPDRWLGGPALADWLRTGAAQARLHRLDATLDGVRVQAAAARLEDIAIAAVGERPGFRALDADLLWRDGQLDLRIDSPDFILDWPPALLAPLPAALDGALIARPVDGHWEVGTPQLAVRGADFAFDAAGALRFDGGRPSADLRVSVDEGPVVAAKQFWIRHKMPPQAAHWLDRALVDGRLLGGRLVLRGDFDDWPFTEEEGRFLAEAELADITLAYQPDWPQATGLSGRATFLNSSFAAEVSAEVAGNAVQRASGRIDSFAEPRLLIDVAGSGSGSDLLDLLRDSPLAEHHGEHLDALSIGGRADVDLTLDIPLKASLGEFSLNGRAHLHAADLRESRWNIALDGAEGDVDFSHRGLRADDLAVRHGDQPARLSIALGAAADAGEALRARLQGRLQAGSLIAGRAGLDWLQPHLSGSAEWHIEVRVPEAAAPTLSLASDMVGVHIGLPPPLTKAAAVRMPLRAEIELGEDRGNLDLRLGALMRLDGRINDSGRFDGVIAFGEADAVAAPTSGLRVVGQAPTLDASAWLAMSMGGGEGDFRLHDIDLFTGELALFGSVFGETRLRLDRPPTQGVRVRLDGPALQGRVELPPDEQWNERGITVHFERLHWRSRRGGAAAGISLPPSTLPPIHLWVGDLHFGAADLGETRLETFPLDNGLRVDLFESRSPAMQLFGRGSWMQEGGRQHSRIELEFTAQDLGDMLAALGFSDLIEGGQTLARLRVGWPGSPMAFAMDAFDGDLEISVGQGRIPQVEPGAGRFLGLFSLTEIPRRLALDFSDFFRSGLVFNTISGHFTFAAGDAHTDDLTIDSSAAQIHIRGRTGLRARDYAQTMEVLPRTGSVLPLVGAIAGGPAGAAIGAVAQAVLQQPLKQVNRTLYRVEGDWDAPRVEVIERGPVRPEPGKRPGPPQ